MSERIRYTDEPLGDLEVVPDFLPRPEDLVFRDEGVKVTISLSKRSVAFFKDEARKHNTQGTYTLTLNGDILIFTDGLIDGHSINVTHKPLSFQILRVTDKELVLRPLPGNLYVGDWHLQSCK